MVDTHCHVDLYDQPLVIAREAERLRITTVAVTYLPSHFEIAEQQLQRFEFVRPALGLHPLAVRDHECELPKFRRLAERARLVGEVGLDFSAAGRSTRITQEATFSGVVDALRGKHRFITLHSRGAEDTVLLKLQAADLRAVVFHWFTGTRNQISRILDAGHLLSVNPAMIRSTKWQEFIKFVPRSAILTESDGPFAKNGKTAASPLAMPQILKWLSDQWNCSLEAAAAIVDDNFDRLIRSIPLE